MIVSFGPQHSEHLVFRAEVFTYASDTIWRIVRRARRRTLQFFRLLHRVVARMFIGLDLCSLPLLQFQLSDESAEVGAAGRADAPASTASLDRVSPDRENR